MFPLIVFGQVFTIQDEKISIPDADSSGNRTFHRVRWVVVVSNNPENTNRCCPVITVVPCTTRIELVRYGDVLLKKDIDFVEADCLSRVRLAQPVCKDHLLEYKGSISEDKKVELYVSLGHWFGLRLLPASETGAFSGNIGSKQTGT